jgi:Uma2 family endonuclease
VNEEMQRTATVPTRKSRPPATKLREPIGPFAAGIRMKPREFDRAEFVDGWRYELIDGVLVVSPSPSMNERDPNEELGHLLRNYRDSHPDGSVLDQTINEETIYEPANRRRADRAIWTGLGRKPTRRDVPSILVEFVSKGRRNQTRDYEEKRDEYLALGVVEYWVFDRFASTLTVFSKHRDRFRKRLFKASQSYSTDLLPGFVVPIAKLLELANSWDDSEDRS